MKKFAIATIVTRTIRPFTLFFSHGIALAGLCGFFMGLTALSGAALAQNPVPLINQPLVPDTVAPGGAGFTLTVNGIGFVSGSKVNWNGTRLVTTFASGSRLTANVPASHDEEHADNEANAPRSNSQRLFGSSSGSGGLRTIPRWPDEAALSNRDVERKTGRSQVPLRPFRFSTEPSRFTLRRANQQLR
jgi:hypothetical protein